MSCICRQVLYHSATWEELGPAKSLACRHCLQVKGVKAHRRPRPGATACCMVPRVCTQSTPTPSWTQSEQHLALTPAHPSRETSWRQPSCSPALPLETSPQALPVAPPPHQFLLEAPTELGYQGAGSMGQSDVKWLQHTGDIMK